VASTTIYIRLAATAAVSGTYNSQSIAVSSDGASTVNVATAASGNTVSAKGLTITGLSATNKVYDRTTTVTVGGTATYVGLANNESHAVTNSVTWAFGDKTVANGKVLVRTGDFTAPNSNYTITSQPSLSADITPKELTIGNAAVTTRAYNTTTVATITGDLQGIVSGDTVTLSGTGTFASANAGAGISVTSTSTLGGADAPNYSLTQPTGLTGTINKATQTITFGSLPVKAVGDANFSLSASTTAAGLTISYASSNSNVATVSGSTVTVVGSGTTTITASQTGNENYEAAPSVNQTLTVTKVLFTEGLNNSSTYVAVSGGAYSSGTSGTGDRPASVNLYTEGTHSLGANNTTVTVTSDAINTTQASEISLNFRLAAFSVGTTGNGMDAGDAVTVAISIDDGATWLDTLKVTGASTSNAYWGFSSGTGTATTAYDGDITAVSFAPAGSAARTTDGYSTVTVTGLPQAEKMKFKITMNCNAASERWNLDEIILKAALGSPAIAASGTLAAVNTTVGTASATPTSFKVSGLNMSAGVIVTPPAGFEVSTSATFASSVGDSSSPITVGSSGAFGSVTVYARLKASAAIGTYSGNIILSSTGATSVNVATVASTVSAISLASGDITLTPGGDGSYTASAAGGAASFSYSYAGRTTNGLATSYNNSSAPTAAGYYTVTATATGNYSGSKSQDYFVAGPVAGSDAVTKPADNSRIKIPTATLLANDSRIHSDGSVLTDNLAITAVSQGTGTAASLSGAFVLFTPSSAGSDSFTYTVTDLVSGKTATGTVTVTTETSAPAFTLQIVGVGTAVFAGGNTSVTHDFIGVPNQTYTVEYSTDLTNWTSAGNQSTGSTGSFSVTLTKAGDSAATWNGSMFFRASVAP
jgi:hypothetical protein